MLLPPVSFSFSISLLGQFPPHSSQIQWWNGGNVPKKERKESPVSCFLSLFGASGLFFSFFQQMLHNKEKKERERGGYFFVIVRIQFLVYSYFLVSWTESGNERNNSPPIGPYPVSSPVSPSRLSTHEKTSAVKQQRDWELMGILSFYSLFWESWTKNKLWRFPNKERK